MESESVDKDKNIDQYFGDLSIDLYGNCTPESASF